MRTASIPNLYRTSDIAKIIGTEEWRIKNFSQGAAYNLAPSLRVGTGERRARLYTTEDVLRMAIAHELVTIGLTPEAVGTAMRVISDEQLASWSKDASSTRKQDEEPNWRTLTVLMNVRGTWKVTKAEIFRNEVLRYDSEWRGSFVLNVSALVRQTAVKINELEATKQ